MKNLSNIALSCTAIFLLTGNSSVTAQDSDLSRLIAPPAGAAARPLKRTFQMVSEASSYVLHVDSITVRTIFDTSKWPNKSRLRVVIEKSMAYDGELSFAMDSDLPPEGVLFDIDHNGYRDILIETYPAGVTGIGANAPITLALMFHPNNRIDVHELSSFFGSDDLFYDFDGDKKYEFVCLNRVAIDTSVYYVANLFGYKNHAFVNVSKSHKMFPAFFKEGETGYIRIDHPPVEVRKRSTLASPSVW